MKKSCVKIYRWLCSGYKVPKFSFLLFALVLLSSLLSCSQAKADTFYTLNYGNYGGGSDTGYFTSACDSRNIFPNGNIITFSSTVAIASVNMENACQGGGTSASTTALGGNSYSFLGGGTPYLLVHLNTATTTNVNAGSSIIFDDTGRTNTTSTISFAFPTNGESVGVFDNWALDVTGINASGSYEVSVTWQATLSDGTLTQPITQSTGNLNFINPNWYPYVPFVNPVDFANDASVKATAILYDSQDPNNPNADLANPIVIASTTETFSLLSIPNASPSSTLETGGLVTVVTNSSGTITTSTTSGFSNANITPTSTAYFAACGSIIQSTSKDLYIGEGIEMGVCGSFVLLVNPPSQITGILYTQYQNLSKDFPFSLFFGLQNLANNNIGGFVPDGSSTLNYTISADFDSLPSAGITQNTSTIPLLTPTLFSDYFGANFTISYYGVILAMEGAVLLIGLWKMIFFIF